jgi:hypothetical protein
MRAREVGAVKHGVREVGSPQVGDEKVGQGQMSKGEVGRASGGLYLFVGRLLVAPFAHA